MKMDVSKAIQNHNLVKFEYEGGSRLVEPHCYGITTAGNEGLRADQVGGYSSSGKMGWKMFDLSKARQIQILVDTFKPTRLGYKSGDKGMSEIYQEL